MGIYTRQAKCAPIRAEEGLLGVLCPPGSTTSYRDLPDDQHIGGYLSTEQLLECGVDALMLDSEGRCVVVEFPAFVLFGLYCPANSSGLRDDFRHGFHLALDMRIRNLIKEGKRVVVTGDLNVSRSEIDTANAEESMRKEGISHEQYVSTPNRRIFNQLLEGGEVFGERDEGREEGVMWDICREFHPDRRGMYSHWEQKINARPGNFGSRIDFILCSLDMKSWFTESNTQDGLMGSDHCPVYAVMKDEVDVSEGTSALVDIMSPSGYFVDGKRLKEYSTRDVPVFSGKLLPEFDKRRSIRDMFTKKPSLSQSTTLDVSTAEGDTDITPTPAPTIPKEITPPPPPPPPSADSPFSVASQTSVATSVASPASKPAAKRSASDAPAGKGSKRAKGNASSATTASAKGQQSLKGFFKPKTTVAEATTNSKQSALPAKAVLQTSPQASSNTLVTSRNSPQTAKENSLSPLKKELALLPIDTDFPPDLDGDTIIDPIVSKESWSKLFSKPVGPRCEHDEPCKTMKTKKPGFNCGREFWMCQR